MKILITGATGFVGRGILPALLDAGHACRALVRGGSERKLPAHERCEPVTGDPLLADDVRRALDGCEAVVHLIGTRREQIKRTGLGYEEIDVGSARVMATAMREAGVRRILLLSAGAIGKSHYVQCKARAEQAVTSAGLAWTIFRPAFIIAPGQRYALMFEPALALMSLFGGRYGDVARRSRAVYREQLANSMVWALGHAEAIGQIIDVPRIRTFSRTITTHA